MPERQTNRHQNGSALGPTTDDLGHDRSGLVLLTPESYGSNDSTPPAAVSSRSLTHDLPQGCLRVYRDRRNCHPIAIHAGFSDEDIAELVAIYRALGYSDTHIEIDLAIEECAA